MSAHKGILGCFNVCHISLKFLEIEQDLVLSE